MTRVGLILTYFSYLLRIIPRSRKKSVTGDTTQLLIQNSELRLSSFFFSFGSKGCFPMDLRRPLAPPAVAGSWQFLKYTTVLISHTWAGEWKKNSIQFFREKVIHTYYSQKFKILVCGDDDDDEKRQKSDQFSLVESNLVNRHLRGWQKIKFSWQFFKTMLSIKKKIAHLEMYLWNLGNFVEKIHNRKYKKKTKNEIFKIV